MSLESLETKFDDLCVLLKGNGRLGFFAKVQIMWEGKKTRMGLLDWCFRVTIMIVVSFIAVKVGMK